MKGRFVVLDSDRVIHASQEMSSAFAFRDGFGSGIVCEVLSEAQENAPHFDNSGNRQSHAKHKKNSVRRAS